MQLEFLVLYQIFSEVEALDDSGKWGYHGVCNLSVKELSDKWNMSPNTVRNAIKCLELSGIITVQYSRGRSSHTITVTPHTTWVVTDFRELRAIANKSKRSPSPVAQVTDTVTPSPDTYTLTPSPSPTDTVTDTSFKGDNVPLQTYKTTPSPDTVTPSPSGKPSPIPKPKLDTVTDNNGNGYRHNAYAVNLPLPVIGSPCPEDIKAKYCKRSPILSPSPDTVTDTATDTVTPITLPVMDSSGNAIDTVTISVGKSKSRKSRKYSPSPGQYEDSDNDDLPIFGMSYPEYRASDLWNRK